MNWILILLAATVYAADAKPPLPVAVKFESEAGVSEATAKLARETLDAVFAERADLERRDEAKSQLKVTVHPLDKDRYSVELDFTGENGRHKQRSFKMKPQYKLRPELKRQLGIVIPEPKRAKAHPNDLTPEELKEGYKR